MKKFFDDERMGGLLRYLRKRQGHSQEVMADFLGVGQSHVSGIERGVKRISLNMLLGYCRMLIISPGRVMSLYEKRANADGKREE